MEDYIIVAAGSLAVITLAIMSIALSYGRFLKGELKTVAKLLPRFKSELNYIIYFGMMIVGLFLIRAAGTYTNPQKFMVLRM